MTTYSKCNFIQTDVYLPKVYKTDIINFVNERNKNIKPKKYRLIKVENIID